MRECEVSVIVPVYNVEDYMDECLESIVNQTFKGIEILLIVGKSTDTSTEKCYEWAKKDPRIYVIDEWEPGLGSARNQGVELASGKYIVFVDSDDYLHEQYIEELHNAIIREDADVAECDFYRVRNFSNEMEYSVSTNILGKEFNKTEKLQLENVSMWKLMIKRSLLLDNKIRQPNPPNEDFVTYPLILACARKMVSVNRGLYFYRRDRQNSLRDFFGNHANEKLPNSIDGLINNFVERNIYEENKKDLSVYIRRGISRLLSPVLTKMEKEDYLENRKQYVDKYTQYFYEFPINKVMLLGSFNLTRIINKLQVIEDPYMRIQFSSIIAITSAKELQYGVVHKNSYRQYMVQREFSNDFERILKEESPECFYWDLLEERHDILKVGNCYYTKSDAFESAVVDGLENYEIIERTSSECTELWKQSCDKFMKLLFQYIEPEKVCVVENYLAEEHGDGTNIQQYSNIEDIRKINDILREYYSYIRYHYPEVKMVEAYKVELYYTDDKYEFGCYPWHLNEWANIRIAKKIEELEEA